MSKKNIGAMLALYPCPVIVVDESWLKDADRMGTISGNKVDKSNTFAWTMGENGAPLIDEAKVRKIACTSHRFIIYT